MKEPEWPKNLVGYPIYVPAILQGCVCRDLTTCLEAALTREKFRRKHNPET